MIANKEKAIDGRRVSVLQFPGKMSLIYKLHIANIILPAISKIPAAIKNLSLDSFDKGSLENIEIDLGFVSDMMGTLCEKNDPARITDLVMQLLSRTSIEIDGKLTLIDSKVFDEAFPGDLVFMWKCVFFVVEANWGNFFLAPGIVKFLTTFINRKKTTTKEKSTE